MPNATRTCLISVATALLSGGNSAASFAQGSYSFRCMNSEWAYDSQGLRYRGTDGHWHYLDPPGFGISMTLEWERERPWTVAIDMYLVTPRLLESLTRGAVTDAGLASCNAAVAGQSAPLFLFLDADGRLPAGWRVPVTRFGRSARIGYIIALAGNDLVLAHDQLFVLRDDRPTGTAVSFLALDSASADSLTGVARDIAQALRAIGAQRVERARETAAGVALGTLNLRVRDRAGRRQDLTFPLPPVTAASDETRAGTLVCRRGDTTMRVEVPAGRLSDIRQLAARMGYAASDCRFLTQ